MYFFCYQLSSLERRAFAVFCESVVNVWKKLPVGVDFTRTIKQLNLIFCEFENVFDFVLAF